MCSVGGSKVRGLGKIQTSRLPTHALPQQVPQGFGNVGSWAAQILYEMGGRVVAVSDAFGAVANEHGLQVGGLRAAQAELKRCWSWHRIWVAVS